MDKELEALAEQHGSAFSITAADGTKRVFTDPREFAEAAGYWYSEAARPDGSRIAMLSMGESEGADDGGKWLDSWKTVYGDFAHGADGNRLYPPGHAEAYAARINSTPKA